MTSQLANRIAFRVYGQPIPQGSKVANRHGGGVRDANAKTLKPWRAAIAGAAADAVRYHDDMPYAGPVALWARFTFARPASHYRTGRNAHLLKDTAPAFPGHSCGDVDKLVRAVLDGITGPILLDDTQVIDLRRVRKMWAGEDEYALDCAGVDIILEAVTP